MKQRIKTYNPINGLSNSELEQIEEKGFFIKKEMLSKNLLEECWNVYNSNQVHNSSLYNTLEVNNKNHRKTIADRLIELLKSSIGKCLPEYKFVGVNFAVKKPGIENEFKAHLDDIHAEPSLFKGINIWIPLIDVNKENGTLFVLPKSHKFPDHIRGIGLPFAYQIHLEELKPYFQFMKLNAGDALVFDDRIIHGSLGNNTDQERLAIICGLIPKIAEPIVYMHYEGLKENQVEKFHAPPSFFNEIEIGKRPTNFKSYGLFKYSEPKIKSNELLNILNPKDTILSRIKSFLSKSNS